MAGQIPYMPGLGDSQPTVTEPNMMQNLAGNKLLLQYLSAAGMDIGGGKPIGANVNAVTQQNIAAQNYAKMLQKLLAGGGKVSMDKESVTIKHPVTAGNPLGTGGQAGTPGLATGDRGPAGENVPVPPSQTNPAPASNQALSLGALNPSASPLGDFSGSDLAGLTPQDISSALQLRMKSDEMGRQSVNDVYDNMLKVAKIQSMSQPESAFPVPVPGLGPVSIEQWKALPADVRSYAAYVYQSKKANPTEPVMSQEEFKKIAPDTQIQYLKALQDDPSLFAIAKELKAGTTVNIDTKTEEMKAKNKLSGQLYFGGGEHLKDIEKAKSSEDYQRKYFNLKADNPAAAEKFARDFEGKFIDKNIIGRGGKMKVRWIDESKGIAEWTVTWPSGDTTTITN